MAAASGSRWRCRDRDVARGDLRRRCVRTPRRAPRRLGPGPQQPGVARGPGHRRDVGRLPRGGGVLGDRRVGDAARDDRHRARARGTGPAGARGRGAPRGAARSRRGAAHPPPRAPRRARAAGWVRRPDRRRATSWSASTRPSSGRLLATVVRARRRGRGAGGLGELAAVRRRLAGADPDPGGRAAQRPGRNASSRRGSASRSPVSSPWSEVARDPRAGRHRASPAGPTG